MYYPSFELYQAFWALSLFIYYLFFYFFFLLLLPHAVSLILNFCYKLFRMFDVSRAGTNLFTFLAGEDGDRYVKSTCIYIISYRDMIQRCIPIYL